MQPPSLLEDVATGVGNPDLLLERKLFFDEIIFPRTDPLEPEVNEKLYEIMASSFALTA